MAYCNLKTSNAKEISDYLSLLQIKFDCDTVKSLIPCLQSKGGSVISLGLMPYLSLTTNSVLEYLHSHGYANLFDVDARYIADLRLKLKMFENGYVKAKRMVLNIDYLQDQIFKRQSKLDSKCQSNTHYNLGVYTDVKGRILYNTHYAYYALQNDAFIKKSIETVQGGYKLNPGIYDLSNKKAHDDACECSRIINAVANALESFDSPTNTVCSSHDIDVYYSDCNTNVNLSLFPLGDEGKALWLYLLHTLSAINYILYGLSIYEKADNGWWLKNSYITFFYAHRKLRDLKAYLIQNNMLTDRLAELITRADVEDMSYINSDFRNCLMHADLMDKKGEFKIELYELDISKPYFGLIETCFEGRSYSELKLIIYNKLNVISSALSAWLQTDKLSITPLD